MIFPSLFTRIEPGLVSSFSVYVVIAFSFFLNHITKFFMALLIGVLVLIGVINNVSAAGAVPGFCGTMCMANRNYYGSPYGGNPIYSYPSVYPNYMNTNNSWNFSQSPYQPMWMSDCPTCMARNNSYYSNSYYPSYYSNQNSNWWSPYGYQNYSNYNAPGVYFNGGLHGGYYPGTGQIAAGKPNIYFSTSKPLKNVKLKVKLPEPASFLALIPQTDNQDTWKFNLTKKGLLDFESVVYDYLFYDYRVDQKYFQNENGFCVKQSDLMPKLIQILIDLKFKTNEVVDFSNYWSDKMSVSESYCVYPQLNAELNKAAPIETNQKIDKATRVLFVVLPKEFYQADENRPFYFPSSPKQEWQLSQTESTKATNLELREWGVAFMMTDL